MSISSKRRIHLRFCFLVSLIAAFAIGVTTHAESIPYPDILDASAIRVERLDSILENALILGNGDINGLVYSEQGQLQMMVTKNDVWDARLDSKLDPPIPTLAEILELGRPGPSNDRTDSYHSHPYPCPRACAKLLIGASSGGPYWRQIRAQGKVNTWTARDTGAVMGIEGGAQASNGYALELQGCSTAELSRLEVDIEGTPNARFYIDLMDERSQVLFKTGWLETPTAPETRVFDLPEDTMAHRLILYTWTEDGSRAENHFRSIVFAGSGAKRSIDLSSASMAAPLSPGSIDLRRASISVTAPVATEFRALAHRNVFLIKTSARGTLIPTPSADTPAAVSGREGEVSFLDQKIPGDADWPGMSFAVAMACRGDRIVVAVVTSREANDYRERAIHLARSTSEDSPRQLIAAHERSWEDFWSASGIRLDDASLNRMWYRNLYFLRCVVREGAMAPGLFASLIDASPAWHGDYHTNYNIQQTFWSAFNTNHTKLAEPYDRLMSSYLPRASWLCRQIFSFAGAYYPHVIFAYEPPHPDQCRSPVGRQYIHHVWGYTMGVPAFTVQPIWWHYKYRPDRTFLKKTAYPVVREVALFQVNFMDRCEKDARGQLVLAPTISPEHWGWTDDFDRNRNCTFDIAMFRYIFEAAIEGATELGVDAELTRRWKEALRRLPAYPTTGGDQPVVVDVEGAPPITYNIAIPAIPVFPGDVVTWFSPPRQKELFARSIEGCRWNGNNSTFILAVARARLSMPGSPEWLRAELEARLRPNGTLTLNRLGHHFNNFGHYTEQFAASMAVGELLVQSVGDIIRIFPAWPRERDAAFTNLRAQGGFLISSNVQRGKITRLDIESTAGGTLRLLSPWPEITVRKGDASVACTIDKRGIVELETDVGERYRFSE